MIHGYAETYLSDAMNNLGDMMDYAVHDCNYEADIFFSLFISSGIAKEFGVGNPKFIAGMSGVELTCEVVFRVYDKRISIKPSENIDKSQEFWAGWVIAYYQWYSNEIFENLNKLLPFSDVLRLYPTLHEADIEKFTEVAEGIIRQKRINSETNLSRLRKARGLSQKELSEQCGVSFRMIQLYEQRQNDINKAQASTLLSLAQGLSCQMRELLEC